LFEIKYDIYLQPILIKKNKNTMKKVLSIVAASAIFAIVACGPSADEKAKAEQAKLDSIEQQRIADSTLQAQEAAMSAPADTTAVSADSTAATTTTTEAPATK